MIHSLVWVLWLLMVMVFILSTRNPIYLGTLLTSLFILGHHLSHTKKIKNWMLPNLRFLLTMIFLSTVINSLFSHVGQEVVFTVPQQWPLIGGKITLEGLVYGALNGLVIGALYILFNIINLALNVKQITRMIPRAFHPIAMSITIALTFFPSIQKRAQEIKEAQMIRGNPMKKISDWLPIFIPLLVTSLENAFLLAESMTARGFHKQTDLRTPKNLISLILGGFAFFSGWVLQLYRYPRAISLVLYAFGAGLILLTLYIAGKSSQVTRYHQERWKPADMIMAFLIALCLFGFIYLKWAHRLHSLNYSPYPHLICPTIQVMGLFFSLLPLIPILGRQHDKN